MTPLAERYERLRSQVVRSSSLLAALWLLVHPAAARHTAEEHITDDTAWTREGGSFRLGLFKTELALHDRFTVGTYLWPWLLRTSNLYAKWQFDAEGPLTWATRFGFFRLDSSALQNADENAPVFSVIPLELLASYEFTRQSQLSQGLVYTAVRVNGEVDEEALSGALDAGVSNLQYLAAYEYRASETFAVVVTGRYLLFQTANARGNVILRPDDFTTIEIVGSGSDDESLNFRAAFSVVPALVWSWDIFNLRLGLGYGNWNVPGINFVLPNKTAILDVDLYWIWD